MEGPTTLDENDHLEGDDDEDSLNVGSFFPIAAQKMTEKEAVRMSVTEGQTSAKQVVPWPQRGDTPINSLSQKVASRVLFPLCYPLVLVTVLLHESMWLRLETTISRGMEMAGLRDTHASVTLHSTRRCGDILYRLEGFTSNSTRVMYVCHWMS